MAASVQGCNSAKSLNAERTSNNIVVNGSFPNQKVYHIRKHETANLNGYREAENGKVHNGHNGKVYYKSVPPLDWSRLDTSKESFEPPPFMASFVTHLGFYILMILSYINQLVFKPKAATEKNREGYARLYNPFEQFYSRYVYRRVRDCWNRPICSSPGAEVTLKDRISKDYNWTFSFTGTETRCINLGSYNYLGFAEGSGVCADESVEAIQKYGLAMNSPRAELGTIPLHKELEAMTARFLGTEAAIIFGMGFATNSLSLPAILNHECLVLSDEKNHASLILGLRLSRATVHVFKHNNMPDLERKVREAVARGRPGGAGPWRKILIVVEGVYSMEGSIVQLPAVIAIKKRYKCYLYLDEAHSIGAMGPHGRGIVDYYGLDPGDVDVLMGTFTKSFGSAGGYIAGSKRLINCIRAYGHAHSYAHSMAPPVAQQVLSSMRLITDTPQGAERVATLARNTRYFRRRLRAMGVITHGHEDSPVVPMLVYMYSKIGSTVRGLTEQGIAVVGVGFPATPLLQGRIRFCISAAHTKEHLDKCLDALDHASSYLGLRHSKQKVKDEKIEY